MVRNANAARTISFQNAKTTFLACNFHTFYFKSDDFLCSKIKPWTGNHFDLVFQFFSQILCGYWRVCSCTDDNCPDIWIENLTIGLTDRYTTLSLIYFMSLFQPLKPSTYASLHTDMVARDGCGKCCVKLRSWGMWRVSAVGTHVPSIV